jgi:hypothetical protein
VIRAWMTTKLAEVKQELNTALLKVIEKDGAIGRLSKQLQSKCQNMTLYLPCARIHHNLSFCSSFRGQGRARAIADGSGVECGRLEPGPGRRVKSGAISQTVIGDIAKLGTAMSTAMAGLGMTFGLMTPETLIEEVGRLPCVVHELELTTARRGCTESSPCSSHTTKGSTAWR